MPDSPPNVKVYDRPEPKRPSPAIVVVALVVVLIVGYFLYRMFVHPVPQQHANADIIHVKTAFWQDTERTDGRWVSSVRP